MARSLGEELLELPPNELIARVHQIEGRVQAVTQALSQANRYREQPVLVNGEVCRVGGWVGGGGREGGGVAATFFHAQPFLEIATCERIVDGTDCLVTWV